MLLVKAVVSGMSVSLRGNVSVTKTRKMLEGHVEVCFDINTIMIILVKAGFTHYQWSGQMLVNDIFVTNMPISPWFLYYGQISITRTFSNYHNVEN